MSLPSAVAAPPPAVPDADPAPRDRLIGRHRGAAPGPTLVVIGALHGNEPAGVRAAERVLGWLAEADPPLRGEFVALVGNRRARAVGERFVTKDLNRLWTRSRIRALTGEAGVDLDSEDLEQRELLDALDAVIARARGPVTVLDLHTTSADSAPFFIVADTLRNRRFARAFPVPVVLGLEEQIEGPLLEYLTVLGHRTLAFEAGPHESPRAAALHCAVLWRALAELEMVDPAAVPQLPRATARLRAAGQGLPSVVELRYRHEIHPGDEFRMRPGYRNFEPVRQGELLARDRHGPVRAPSGGLIFMPLYQALGDDGFFIGRDVRPFWLAVSSLLRRLHLSRFARFFPGVHPAPGRPGVLVIDRRVARLFPLEVFHLLGYRRRRAAGAFIEVSRRPYDLGAPRVLAGATPPDETP